MAKQRVIEAVLKFKDEFSKNYKAATASIKNSQKVMKQAGADIWKAGKKMETVGRSLTKNLTVPIVGLGVASSKMYMDFDKSMKKVQTIADQSGISMQGMEDKILALSDKTGVASSDIANSVYDAISAGQTTAKGALETVEAAVSLGKAGFTETGNALNLLTTIQNSYGKSAGSMENISDMLIMTQNRGKTTVDELANSMGKIIPIAKSNKVSLEDLNAGYVALTKNGVKTDQATTWLKSTYNELGKSSSKVGKILKSETGMSFDELTKSGKNVGEVLQILEDYAGKTGKKFNDLWGNSNAKSGANAILGSIKDYNDGLKDLQKSAGTTKTALGALGKTDSAKLTKAINRLKNDMIKLGATVLPIVMPYIEKGLKFVDDLAKKFDSLNPKQKDLVVKLGLVTAAIGPLLTGGGKAMQLVGNLVGGRTGIQGLFGSLKNAGGAFKTLGGFAKTAFLAIPGPVKIALAVIAALAVAGVLVYKNWDKIKAKAQTVFTKIKPIIMPVIKQIKEMAAQIKQAISSIVAGVKARVAKIKVQFGQLAEAARPVFRKIQAFLKPILVFLGKVFVKKIQVTLTILGTVIKVAVEEAKVLINGIMDVLSGIISFVTNVFKGNWKAAWEDVKNIFKTIWDTFAGVIKAPLNGMISLVNKAIGRINGIKITIPDWVPEWGGKSWGPSIPTIPQLYTGTSNWPGGLAIIHDRGGEVVDLPQGSRVYPHEKSQKMMTPNINISIANMSVREEADIDRIAVALYNRLELAYSNMG